MERGVEISRQKAKICAKNSVSEIERLRADQISLVSGAHFIGVLLPGEPDLGPDTGIFEFRHFLFVSLSTNARAGC